MSKEEPRFSALPVLGNSGVIILLVGVLIPSCERAQVPAERTVQIPADPGYTIVAPGESEAAGIKREDGVPNAPRRSGGRRVEKTEREWSEELPEEVFRVTRLGETEPRFSGDMHSSADPGVYLCVCCDAVLFSSEHKSLSNSGWPTFSQPAGERAVWSKGDHSAFRPRVAVLCSVCDAHLGHLFQEARVPAAERYRINATALQFVEQQEEDNRRLGSSNTN